MFFLSIEPLFACIVNHYLLVLVPWIFMPYLLGCCHETCAFVAIFKLLLLMKQVLFPRCHKYQYINILCREMRAWKNCMFAAALSQLMGVQG
jgi:hypothetical protein